MSIDSIGKCYILIPVPITLFPSFVIPGPSGLLLSHLHTCATHLENRLVSQMTTTTNISNDHQYRCDVRMLGPRLTSRGDVVS
jgi:hypothetical protein